MPRPSRTEYDASRIDWKRLRAYAKRVARETRVKRKLITVTSQIEQEREVKGGLFGLSRRLETFSVPVSRNVEADHWELTVRYWLRKTTKPSPHLREETTRNSMHYCLKVDGSLVVRVEGVEEIIQTSGRHEQWDLELSESEMSESDVMLFDFEPEYYYRPGKVSVETNRDPDPKRLKHHAKGVGLTLALKALLT